MGTFRLIDRFIPDWLRRRAGFGVNYMIGQKGPVWIDTAKPNELYNEVSQLRKVIHRKALMFSNMELLLVDVKDKKVMEQSPELVTLLQTPNCYQSQNEFLRIYKTQEQVYGNQFMYRNKPSVLGYATALHNISPLYMQPDLSGKIFDQVVLSDIIKGYKYDDKNGGKKTYLTDEILWSRLTDLNHPLIGQSPIVSLKYPVSNTLQAYKFLNATSTNMGPIGILSNGSKDSAGSLPLTAEERERVEREFSSKYGVDDNQIKIKVTEAMLTWQAMSYPTKDMLLMEQIDANTLEIIDAYGLNANIFSSKAATYENVKQGLLGAYQDTIIPEADQFTQAFSRFIGVPEGMRLVASYDHLQIMKENKKKGLEGINTLISALNQAVQLGLLDAPTAQQTLHNELLQITQA